MPEQINIASFSIDFDDVLKESAKLKRQIDSLKKSQKELDQTTEEGSKAFALNEVQIKKLSKAYRDNQQFATALDSANEDLNKTMTVQGKSTQELRDSRSQLNQISKNIIGNTEEEVELRNKLNQAIDDQTEALRGQSSDFNKNKDRVGEYKDSILEAVEELRNQKEVLLETRAELGQNLKGLEKGTEAYEDLSKAILIVDEDLVKVNESLEEQNEGFDASILSLEGFQKKSKEAGGAGKAFAEGGKAAIKSLWGIVKAATAFIFTPLGALLAILAGAFLLIKNAMDRNEESANKVKKAFSAFSGIVKGVLKALEPLGKFLINYVVWWFDKVEKAVFGMAEGIVKALSFLGFDEAAEKVEGFTESIRLAAENAKKLTEAELELQKAQRESRKIQLDYQKDAEKLRQIRDDETKSMKERIQANEDLGASLKKQAEEELKIAKQALELAELRIELDGENSDNLDARAAALTEIADIEERITGQESEQIVNRVQLEKEAADKIKAIKEEEAEAAAKVAEEKIEASEKAAEEAVRLAQYELDNYLRVNKQKYDSDKYLTAAAVEEEKKRLDAISEERRKFAELELEKGVIDKIEYDAAIAEIDEATRASKEEVEAERQEALKQKQAIDFQNRMILLEQEGESEFALASKYLEAEREAEIATAEQTGADVALITQKYDNAERLLQADLTEFKARQNQVILHGVKSLFGESSTIGKAFALAEIANNTVLNATKAFGQAAVFASNPLTLPLALNANIQGGLIVALGAAQAAKTAGIKFSKGDILEGRSHAQGGIPFSLGGQLGFEAEGGESIINKRSTAMFAPLLSAINVAGGGKKFASGDYLGAGSPASSVLINYDLLGLKVAEANKSLPSPVVSVEEINSTSAKVEVIESLAGL